MGELGELEAEEPTCWRWNGGFLKWGIPGYHHFRLHADRNPRRFVHQSIFFLVAWILWFMLRSHLHVNFPAFSHIVSACFSLPHHADKFHLSTNQTSCAEKWKSGTAKLSIYVYRSDKLWRSEVVIYKSIKVSTSCMTRKCLACGKAGHRLESCSVAWRVCAS